MKYVISFLTNLVILFMGLGIYLYSDHIKFERCIKYGESHPEMFGDSCRNFYR